jgi:hypothetical protein
MGRKNCAYEGNLMSTQTWHVSITMDHDGSDVTARAELADGTLDIVGLGVVSTSITDATGELPFQLAAMRSLESLSEALGYAAETDWYAEVDQA